MKPVLKLAVTFVSLAALFTAFMGFAHTRAGHPLLVWMAPLLARSNSCPLGYDNLTSLDERTRVRENLARRHINDPVAVSRKILDFEIGKTTRSEVSFWANSQHGRCRALKAHFEMECTGSFDDANTSTLWLEFNRDEILMSMRGVDEFQSLEKASSHFQKIGLIFNNFAHHGPLKRRTMSLQKLKSGLLNQVSMASDFSNFSASARMTNMGNRVVVTQDYLAY